MRRCVLGLLVVLSFVGGTGVASADDGDGGAKLVGGEPVGEGYPEVVAIAFDGSSGCTGTLIDPRWVLTAAHCIGDEGATIYGGSADLTALEWSIDAVGGHQHPEWGNTDFGFDYGLYELAEPAPVDIDVELADYTDTDLWQPGAPLSIVGFGLTDGLVMVDELLGGTLDVQADGDCVGLLGSVYDPTSMVCLYTPGVSACPGDSGGPVFTIDDDGTLRVVGITSFVASACDSLTVAAWVPGGLSWIESVMGGGEGGPAVYRLFGADRFETAVAVSSSWSATDTVYVATGENYPDSLAAGPAAASDESPILLVQRGAVPSTTAAELERLSPSRIIVVGGTAAVTEGVVATLRQHAPVVDRISGATRIGTAVALARDAFPSTADAVWLAPSTSYQDPLLAGAAAGTGGGPLLLAQPGAPLDAAVRAELQRLDPGRVVVVGGSDFATASLTSELQSLGTTVEVVAGATAYERGVALSSSFPAETEYVVLTTGENFPDALVGAAYAPIPPASPLLLARRDCVPGVVADEVDRLAPANLVLIGGTAALGEDVESLVRC